MSLFARLAAGIACIAACVQAQGCSESGMLVTDADQPAVRVSRAIAPLASLCVNLTYNAEAEFLVIRLNTTDASLTLHPNWPGAKDDLEWRPIEHLRHAALVVKPSGIGAACPPELSHACPLQLSITSTLADREMWYRVEAFAGHMITLGPSSRTSFQPVPRLQARYYGLELVDEQLPVGLCIDRDRDE
jgi:hypothetical protein